MLQEPETRILKGDCLSVLPTIQSESVSLAYLDPPFFTQKKHRLRTRDRSREFSFDDVWSSNREYTEFLYDRLVETRRTLSNKGCLFFHCDRNATHLARFVLDEVMGPEGFKSEIIWHYRRWSSSTKTLLPAHQTIYFYTKSPDYTFNVLWEDYSPSTNVDQILQRRARDAYGKTVYQRNDVGEVVSNGGKKGVPLSDVWDIPYLNPKAKERTGYPTQKPLTLLERIIRIATRENDWVLDPFCGSGTTLVASKMLHRNAIGIDTSDDALALTSTRIRELRKSESSLFVRGRDSYHNVDETALTFLRGLEYVPVQRNKGIDAILKEDFGGTPIPVRVQREGETLIEAGNKLYHASKGKNVRVMFLVARTNGGYMALGDDLPPGVVIINAPALEIQEYLTRLNPTLAALSAKQCSL